jgi:hypothetical protein
MVCALLGLPHNLDYTANSSSAGRAWVNRAGEDDGYSGNIVLLLYMRYVTFTAACGVQLGSCGRQQRRQGLDEQGR